MYNGYFLLYLQQVFFIHQIDFSQKNKYDNKKKRSITNSSCTDDIRNERQVIMMQLCTKEQNIEFNDQFLQLHKNFRDATYIDSQKLGFTVPQLTAIYELYNTPSLTLNELSEKMGLSKSSASAVVARMEKQGIVVREIPQDNRRTVRLSLSQTFIAEQKELLDLKDHVISDLFKFDTLNDGRAARIIDSLKILNCLLETFIRDSKK